MIATVTRWLVWKLDPDQCAEPDWYKATDRDHYGLPTARVQGKRVVGYIGYLTPEMARKLFAAIE